MASLTISEIAMHSTVHIECKNALNNSSNGTGFFFSFHSHENIHVPVIVTNKHVVENSCQGSFHLNMCGSDNKLSYGNHQQVLLDNFEQRWFKHPDPDVDLAIMPYGTVINSMIQNGLNPFLCPLNSSLIYSEEALNSLLPIEDIVMIGYPSGIWDHKNNLPIVRRGSTATPVYVDYLGKKEFLVDAACFPGSSGSPIFLLNQGTYTTRDASIVAGSRIVLLGILYSGPLRQVIGEIREVSTPVDTRYVAISQDMLNLGTCIKANRILDFLPILKAAGIIDTLS